MTHGMTVAAGPPGPTTCMLAEALLSGGGGRASTLPRQSSISWLLREQRSTRPSDSTSAAHTHHHDHRSSMFAFSASMRPVSMRPPAAMVVGDLPGPACLPTLVEAGISGR